MAASFDQNSFVGESPDKVLKDVFGYDSFRARQRETIESVLARRDTLAIMPTGGGKSLCCQIPALIFKGATVVVSPLIALMQDQTSALKAAGVEAVFLNSSLGRDEWLAAARKISSGRAKLLYVSPEGLATSRVREVLRSVPSAIDCVTVDEAHCVSEWGHDFRPDYMEIGSLREEFKGAVFLALTATATSRVRRDIIENLRMKNPAIVMSSFNRENIYLEVRRKRDAISQVVECIKAHPGECGIVYCFSRREVDSLCASLKAMRFSATSYHAGLSDEERSSRQDDFVKGRALVMVATIAFGMGINVPNVRFVVHCEIPKSLEQYYQEIGRAGRDGLPSDALLLYSRADERKIRYFFDESADREKSERLLRAMSGYASLSSCRRKALLGYFGEDFPGQDPSRCCDVCSSQQREKTDATIPVQKFLSAVIRTGEKFGAGHVIDVLLGSKKDAVVKRGHDKLSTWGIGKELSRDEWLEIRSKILEEGWAREDGEWKTLSISARGREFLARRERAMLSLSFSSGGARSAKKSAPQLKAAPPPKAGADADAEEARVSSALRALRKKIAAEENVPPYIIFGDRTIADIARKMPASESELLDVHGIGRVKAAALGGAILRIVRGE